MSPDHLVVIGAGEHARVVIDAARSRPEDWVVDGVVAGPDGLGEDAFGLPGLGDDIAYLAQLADVAVSDRPALILGVGAPGEPDRRRAIVARYVGLARWATMVHA